MSDCGLGGEGESGLLEGGNIDRREWWDCCIVRNGRSRNSVMRSSAPRTQHRVAIQYELMMVAAPQLRLSSWYVDGLLGESEWK